MDKFKKDDELARARDQMIQWHLAGRGIADPNVLSVFRKTPREKFVPAELRARAYEDHPLIIGYGQTISQPYIVALMTEVLALQPTDRVLEVGTGSGYQTAILAQLAKEVYSIETIKALYETAKWRLEQLGYRNIYLKHDDGRKGWPKAQPFDKIIVTAGTEIIPPALVEQLEEGGRMVLPVGLDDQDLMLGRKENGVLITKPLAAVRFVPMQIRVS